VTNGRPLRLLLVAERLGPSGVTTYTDNLVRALGARHQLMLVSPGGSAAEGIGSLAGRALVLPALARWGLFKPGRRKLLAAAGNFRPELVHALSGHASPPAAEVCGLLDLPQVITSHHYLKAAGELRLNGQVRRVLAVSQALRENLVNTGKVPRDRVQVVPNGVNVSSYVPREEPELQTGEAPRLPVVGFFGRLAKRKGGAYLVRAAAELRKRGLDAEYLFVGEGPELDRLQRLAEQLGVRERTTFHDTPLSAREIMPAFDVFVAPSLQEALGINILEAMACRVAVVASSVGGIFTVIRDCENGLLAPPRDHLALADRIQDLLGDPKRRLEIARAGRETVETEFSMDSMLAATEANYYAALEQHRS
jgi:glycosyltransferase involved in cell wall biosynthesis